MVIMFEPSCTKLVTIESQYNFLKILGVNLTLNDPVLKHCGQRVGQPRTKYTTSAFDIVGKSESYRLTYQMPPLFHRGQKLQWLHDVRGVPLIK